MAVIHAKARNPCFVGSRQAARSRSTRRRCASASNTPRLSRERLRREIEAEHPPVHLLHVEQTAGDVATARDTYQKLLALGSEADPEKPEIAEAKAFLAKNI